MGREVDKEGPVWVRVRSPCWSRKKRKRKGGRTKHGKRRTTTFCVLCVFYEPLSMEDTIVDEGW